jgi:hypothetical protein
MTILKNLNFLQNKTKLSVKRLNKILHYGLIVTVLVAYSTNKNFAQAPEFPKSYICYRPSSRIAIDGKLDERAWKKAAWTDEFEDIEGNRKPRPLQKTRTKMLWDNTFLYIGAEIEEEDIWAYQHTRDQIVYLENDFEVFIDPDGDTENYYELEINAANNSFDLFLPKTYRSGGRARLNWDIEGLKSAVSIEGTINTPNDKDKRWTLEIAVPLASLRTEQIGAVLPKNNSIWRINFSRVNWQYEITEGKYLRRKNAETNRFIPEYNWVWSPQGVINMHCPEYWGFLQFRSAKAGKKKEIFKPNPIEKMKLLAWNVYAAQKAFYKQNRHYASNPEELSLEDYSKTAIKNNVVDMNSDGNHFTVSVSNTSANTSILIDDHGKLTVNEAKNSSSKALQ